MGWGKAILIWLALNYFTALHALSFNLFSANNGAGLEVQRRILKEALHSLGHTVVETELHEDPLPINNVRKADINIFMERLNPRWFDCAETNWLIPNPEWYEQDLGLLEEIDLIVCMTHETERIFQDLGKKTFYTGFVSVDCYHPMFYKNYHRYLHLAGKNTYKGTGAIAEAWKNEKNWPELTVVSRLSDQPYIQRNLQWHSTYLLPIAMRSLQNQCGIHLCPSETEGFGFSIIEALSAGAVVITTDAPPMNEYITDKRCLVPYERAEPCNLATRYFISPEQLKKTLISLRNLPEIELRKIGAKNRATYLRMAREFQSNLKELLLSQNEKLLLSE